MIELVLFLEFVCFVDTDIVNIKLIFESTIKRQAFFTSLCYLRAHKEYLYTLCYLSVGKSNRAKGQTNCKL